MRRAADDASALAVGGLGPYRGPSMDEPNPDLIAALSEDRALAIAQYGESVAAYRYLVLAEAAPDESERLAYARLADEEQAHKERVVSLFKSLYPDSDFFLTDEEKALIAVGSRLITAHDEAAFRDALEQIIATELRTARFYEALSRTAKRPEVRALCAMLADEGDNHYDRIRMLAASHGVPRA